MAAATQTEAWFSQILQCPICLEKFKRPKVLTCGHTYCTSCLQTHISSKMIHSGTPQACFPCPVCTADIPLSEHNISIEKWVESLPVSSIVSSLLDISGELQTEKRCDQCLKQGKESLAICFCKDCDKFMCIACKQCHDGFPSLSRHDITNINDGDELCFLIPSLSTIEVCPRHSGERIKFFCGDHKTLCCNTCGFLEHRKCDQVITVDDMLKKLDVTMKLKELEANLGKFEEHVKQITHSTKINADTIQKDKSEILEHIHSLKFQLIAKLQKLEDDVIASLESNYKSENLRLQNQEIKGQSLITAINSDRMKLEVVMTHGSEVQKIIMLHNLDQTRGRYFRAISEYQNDIINVRIGFDVDKTFKTFETTLSDLGKINLKQTKLDCLPCLNIVETQFWTISESVPVITALKERKAVKVSEFNVKISGDDGLCYISDILHVKDARILMVDHNNSKLKMFGKDNKCQENMILQGRPWSACSVSETEVAVTIPPQKRIQIIRINEKLQTVREIRTRFMCWHITVVKDQLVITTSGDGHGVLILDMSGKEIKTILTDTCHSEKRLYPLYIKADMTNNVVYISYESGDKLVAYNMNWGVIFTFTNQDMTYAAGIDTDREGNIYLCGDESKSVQQISADGKLIKTLISKKGDNKRPLMIRFYRDTDRFIVTYAGCDFVEVYELSV